MSTRRAEDNGYIAYGFPVGDYPDGVTNSSTQWTSFSVSQHQHQTQHSANFQAASSHHHPGYSDSNAVWITPQFEVEGSYNHPGDLYLNQTTYGTAHHHRSTGYDLESEPEQRHSNASYESVFMSSVASAPPRPPHIDPYCDTIRSRRLPLTGQAASPSSQNSPPPPASPPQEVHSYISLPSMPQDTIECYLMPIRPNASSSNDRGAYQCAWQGCPKAARGEVFKSKDNARVHVQKHFGMDKLFECSVPTCKKTFASEDAAKRHRDTKGKVFSCVYCKKEFSRNDYRDIHQKRHTGLC
ncbi:hypothetical protein K439DRAFT_1639144 [Ramaria rubella]|nr:hypothetical protein K439DRAFT_1643073 [Ramaria rubella]KAF8578130.1 hypothetical protein K439DRAFT_1639144 [Ramaria rubella]